MKESILNVLLYLFEHYIYDQPDLVQDPDTLQNNLIQAGFSATEVSKAFDWLETLAQDRPDSQTSGTKGPMRFCSSSMLEKNRIGPFVPEVCESGRSCAKVSSQSKALLTSVAENPA